MKIGLRVFSEVTGALKLSIKIRLPLNISMNKTYQIVYEVNSNCIFEKNNNSVYFDQIDV